MTELNNLHIVEHENGKISLMVGEQAISDKYEVQLEASIIEDLKGLENGQKIKLIEQFIFSHTDLNFEHAYYYVTGIEYIADQYQLVKSFVYRIKIEGQPEIEHVITNQGQAMTAEDVAQFIQAHVQKSLHEYTDLNYAY